MREREIQIESETVVGFRLSKQPLVGNSIRFPKKKKLTNLNLYPWTGLNLPIQKIPKVCSAKFRWLILLGPWY